MNLIIIKSFHTTSYFVFALLMLVLSSCYTQVDMSSFEKSKSVNNQFQAEVIDSNILGTWQKTIYWMDAYDQVQQLIFDSKHNISFNDDIARTNGNTLSGSFSTRDSVLTIVLDYCYGTEKYFYEVVEGTLTLTPIDMNKFFPYKVSGSRNNLKWINPYYDKGKL